MPRKDTTDQNQQLADFKAALRSKDFAPLYVFCGQEAYLREYYLSQLAQKLSGAADAFNFHRFNAETISPQALADAVEAMPMMAEKTFVRVDDVDFFSFADAERTQYSEILADIPDYCVVALHYDAVGFKINAKMKNLAEVLKTKAVVLEYAKQSERELAAWVCRHFKAGGKEISDELCKYLIFITDGSMTTLGTEIEKVISFCSGSHISREDIDAVVTPVLSAQSFEISNAITDGNYDLALRKMQTLFAMQEDPILILGAISAQFRKLQYAKIITACGKGQETLMELTGMKDYPAGLTMTAARRVSDRFCLSAMDHCLRTDVEMKTSGGDPKQLLELLLAQLAQEVRRG